MPQMDMFEAPVAITVPRRCVECDAFRFFGRPLPSAYSRYVLVVTSLWRLRSLT
jgi:hypothetical protein